LNPALPLLACLGAAGVVGLAAGLAGRAAGSAPTLRREAALAWGALAFAGTALLAPALALPTGIPSPAATLAANPPWLGTGDPAAGNPLLRDVTYQIEPWQFFVRRELRAGRLPLWNPHQFAGAPFWSNGQGAPLFPLHLLFTALPLQLGFVLLPWLRLMIAGCGAWLLGRELGLSRPAALLTALIFPLSGMLVSFLLYPMGNALALVPWVLWSVERIASGARTAWIALAVAGGLQLLAGHPETALHTALLSVLWLLVRGAGLGAWLRFVGGWITAAALAAVQILPFALLLPDTSRWQAQGGGGEPPFPLLLEQPLRLVLPQMYGHPAAGTWWGPFNYSATAVYAGALALPLAAAGLAKCRGDRRWWAVAAVLAFSFAAAYHWPGLRDLLAVIPIVGRAAHHRLIFGVELGLALLAGAGCDQWLEGRSRRSLLAGAGLVALLLAAAWGAFAGEWAHRGLTGEQAAWTAGVLLTALFLVLTLRWSVERRWAVWPLLPGIFLCDLLAAHGGINRALPLERLYPETGAVRFLQHQEGRVAGLGEALRPNAALAYGLHDLRGDDPVKLARFESAYQSVAPGDPVYFQPVQRWNEPWLDRLGVRWIVAGPAEPAPDPRWRLAYAGNEARVYERPGALPLVRWDEGEGQARIEKRVPGLWKIDWKASTPGLLVVAETWDRGWSAQEGGRRLEVVPAEGTLLGVRLGPGGGRVELRYRPAGLGVGAGVSGLALVLILGSLLVGRRRPSPARGGREVARAGEGSGEGAARAAAVVGEGASGLVIRPTTPADLSALSALFADRFGHGLTPEEWHWKYRQIPGEGRSLVAVEPGTGTVLAHAGALALPARWPGGAGPIWQLVDFAGTTRHRGLRAALVDLGRTLLDDLPRPGDAPWIFGFPSERHFRLGERVFGYRPLTEIEPLAGELPGGTSEARLETGDLFGDWAEAIWERCGGLGVRRSAAFLNWRYYARPQRYYRFYRMFSEGEEAFLVFAFVGEEAQAAEAWLPTASDRSDGSDRSVRFSVRSSVESPWLPALLAVAADLRASGLRSWRFWPGLDPGLAAALGLRPTGERQLVGCRGRASGGPDPAAAAAGFPYSMGDYDLV
jgi:hypothetical protein